MFLIAVLLFLLLLLFSWGTSNVQVIGVAVMYFNISFIKH